MSISRMGLLPTDHMSTSLMGLLPTDHMSTSLMGLLPKDRMSGGIIRRILRMGMLSILTRDTAVRG